MKQWQLVSIAGVIASVSAVGGYQLQQTLKPGKQPEVVTEKRLPPKEVVGTKAEEFSLSDVEGEIRYLSEWEGSVIAINFWATWCPPCLEEIPEFIQLQYTYEDRGLQFIGVALQDAEEVRDFIEEYNVNYPSLVGGEDVIALAKKLGNSIGALPYTVIIDRNGQIAFTRRGPLSKSEAESVIQTLL